MEAPQQNILWGVQRLFLLAVRKESPVTCAMARIPADALVLLGGIITGFLRVPAEMHIHPPAEVACKICFTPVCDRCTARYVDCLCGANDLRSRP